MYSQEIQILEKSLKNHIWHKFQMKFVHTKYYRKHIQLPTRFLSSKPNKNKVHNNDNVWDEFLV